MRILALLVLACLGLGPHPAWAQTVKVGAVVPLTGRYGAGGAQIRAGYEIAVEHLNAAGGVAVAGKKMPIELILLDDESDATKTVSRLETLAAPEFINAPIQGSAADLIKFAMLEVSQAAMNDAGGAAGDARGEVILLQQKRAFAGARTFTGDGDAVYAASDDHHVEVLAFERRSGL